MTDAVPATLERGRLRYERIVPEHESELDALILDPRIGETMWVTAEPPSGAELKANLHSKLDHWRRYGWGQWLLRDRTTDAMVGRGGLQHAQVQGETVVEVGWVIVPERWGEGLATELALTSVEVAFSTLELDELVAFTLPFNVASRRVMEKSGFVYERDIVYVGRPHVLYARTREPDARSRDPAGA